jgi:LysR family glycine cleavage system transcriptional activator
VKRTHLPLNALRVFDAAARHLSFTRAADELAVTPAAVGQQIRSLEDVLGIVLFRRTAKGLELTPEAERGLPPLRAGFAEFEESVRLMQEGKGAKTLAIAAPRDFTAKWLAPRLARYAAANPDIRIATVAADRMADFTQANLDLAVLHGAMPTDEEGYSGVALGDGALVAVAAPGIDPATALRIVHSGQERSADGGIEVADAGLAIDAAVGGAGVAMVPLVLAEADVASGRLLRHGEAQSGDAGYWLVAPAPQWRQPKVKALVGFLTA